MPPAPGVTVFSLPVTCSRCIPPVEVHVEVEVMLVFAADNKPRMSFTSDLTEVHAHLWVHQEEER